MNILVTGGLGYIGAHVVMRLKQEGYTPIVLDNNWHKRPNQLPSDVVVKEGDIRHVEVLDQLFLAYPIHGVIHCAGRIQVGESVSNPALYYDNNVTGTIALLNVMVKHQVRYFVFSSSAAVYGEPLSTPIDESHPLAPLSPYGRSKQQIEEILQDYHYAYGMQCGSLRYFNAAGCDPEAGIGELHEPETHLIPLALQTVSGRKASLDVFGDDYKTEDGSCVRDYIHVKDLAAAHTQLLKYLMEGGKEFCFNLGTGKGASVFEIVKQVEHVTGKKVSFTVKARRNGDPAVLVADGSKAHKILGWQATESTLEQIIQDAWAWEQRIGQ